MLARPQRSASAVTGVLTLALVASSVAIVNTLTAPPADAATYSVTGIDVASWQHPGGKAIDWKKVKGAGHDFAIIKATEDTNYTNPYYFDDRADARAAGLVIGSYHFARPKMPISTATAQAKYFAKTIGSQQLTRTLPPVLDIESTGGLSKTNLSKWMTEFLTTLRSATGRTPMIYSYDSFLRNSVANVSAFQGYPLWYANYTSKPPAKMPGTWPAFKIWQHSSTGSVPGISGNTDLNRFNGSYASLLAFASGTIPATVWPRSIQPSEIAVISGKVDPVYAGQHIVRQTRSSSKAPWRTVSMSRVWPSGYYELGFRSTARRTHEIRILLDSRSPYAKVPSKVVSATVVSPWVKASFPWKSIKKNRTVKLSGSVSVFYKGEKVLRQKRGSNGKWTTVSSKKVAKNGTFSFNVKPTKVATYSYRVVLKATGPKATATSRTVKIRSVR